MICRPVQRRPGDEREKSERPQEPPENPKAQPPAHGRTVAPDVTLEEQPKAGTNDRGHAKLQTHSRHARVKLASPAIKGKKSPADDQRPKIIPPSTPANPPTMIARHQRNGGISRFLRRLPRNPSVTPTGIPRQIK